MLGMRGVKELRRIEQTLAGCLKNLRFMDKMHSDVYLTRVFEMAFQLLFSKKES